MLTIPRPLYDELVAHADRGGSEEICGILGGQFDEDQSVVASVHEATNVAAQPTVRYEIDPEQQLELMERIHDAGEDVVGFYHSHPHGPVKPSDTDRIRATWPDRSYVIVTGDDQPSVRSWRWNEAEERFDAEQLDVE